MLMLSGRKSEASWKKRPPFPRALGRLTTEASAEAYSVFMQYRLLHPCILTHVPILFCNILVLDRGSC